MKDVKLLVFGTYEVAQINAGFCKCSSYNSYYFFRDVSNGNLTGFCRSSMLKVADFSYNFFVGSIPKCLGYLPR